MTPRTEIRSLPVPLTDSELRDRGDRLAKVVQDIVAEQDRQADQKAQMKAALAGLQAIEASLATVVVRREEPRDVVVVILPDYGRGLVTYVRQDTGETLDTRPMTEDERQLSLMGE